MRAREGFRGLPVSHTFRYLGDLVSTVIMAVVEPLSTSFLSEFSYSLRINTWGSVERWIGSLWVLVPVPGSQGFPDD